MSALQQCSRAGCRQAAHWDVEWRNPRIHAEGRIKVWLACDEHKEFLHDYLASRGFPVRIFAHERTDAESGSRS